MSSLLRRRAEITSVNSVSAQELVDKQMAEEKAQINVRVEASVLEKIDKKRIELQKELGKIPSRSDVIRLAVEKFVRE